MSRQSVQFFDHTGSGGSQVAQQLAMSGIRNFSLYDNQTLGEENVIRHACGLRYVGWNKTEAVFDLLRDRNPEVKAEIHNEDLMETPDLEDRVRDASVVIMATDNEPSRFRLNEACVRTGTPFVVGKVFTLDDSMMAIWEKSIKPTLLDFYGEALICSNSAGKDPENFFYNICTDLKYGFKEFHAPTQDNPLLPKRLHGENYSTWVERRKEVLTDLKKSNDPLVYAQEHLAEFVDWFGVAFFSREKLLEQGQPVPYPTYCDAVFAVIDTASKTGSENDGTAVTFFAHTARPGVPLMILDWDIAQIEGALLETWLRDRAGPWEQRRILTSRTPCGFAGLG
jgi:hypothetical protein